MEEQTVSPIPKKAEEGLILYSFPDVMGDVIEGKRITRVAWDTKEVYGLLKDGFLCIHIEGEFKRWLVSDGDMFATDWYILPEGN